MDRHTHATRHPYVRARAHEAPGIDPGVALLLAVGFVLLALALGTALYLLLPAAF